MRRRLDQTVQLAVVGLDDSVQILELSTPYVLKTLALGFKPLDRNGIVAVSGDPPKNDLSFMATRLGTPPKKAA